MGKIVYMRFLYTDISVIGLLIKYYNLNTLAVLVRRTDFFDLAHPLSSFSEGLSSVSLFIVSFVCC